jgi:hypothetical protein
MQLSVSQLLQNCTVKLLPSEYGSGTGFFVTRNQILTCAHVVRHKATEVRLLWQGRLWVTATVERVLEEVDLALLRIESPIGEHPPYALMGEEFRPFDQLYVYGYPDNFPDGGSVTLQCEGEVREQEKTLIKVQSGQIRPGHSGSPVLNYDTGKVCGIVSEALKQDTRLGGLLIPVTTVFKYFPELRSHNKQTTNPNHPWLQLLSQQNSSNEQEVLDRYLKQQVRRYRFTRLPLLSNNAESIPLHIETLYIDLPLRQAKDIESVGWQLRESFTSALLVDRASNVWASQQDDFCRISDHLKPGARLAVVGDPGCGKTTLQSFLAYNYACRQLPPSLQGTTSRTQNTYTPQDALPNEPWIPVTLICRDLLEANFDESLVNLIQYQLQKDNFSRRDSQLLADFFEKNMSEGKILLLIDGLDEIPTEEQRQKFIRTIVDQANIYHAQMPIVLTSRIVGFSNVQTLLDSFNHLTVAPLSIDEKKQFVQAWARYVSSKVSDQDSQSIVNKLEFLVCDSREVSKLCENIFLLVLITQISLEDGSFPKRRSDIYRRAVKLMIERRKGGDGLSLTVNEVCPHLEHLALQMRLEGKQYWAETKVLQAIEQLRSHEQEAELQRHTPKDFLNLVISQSGLLNVAGSREIDERGFEHQVIQFFHQSFQEYFAAQALIHKRGILDELRQKVYGLTIVERKIESLGTGEKIEPVVAGQWQEVVRFSISSLNRRENDMKSLDDTTADEAILMLLPSHRTPEKEARALSVFALQALVEEPNLGDETVRAVVNTAIDNLNEFDGCNTVQNTFMDEAWHSAMRSCYEPLCRERLLKGYVQSRDSQRNRIGAVYSMALTIGEYLNAVNAAQLLEPLLVQLSCTHSPEEQVDAALRLTNEFYRLQLKDAQSKIDFLPDSLLQKTVQQLLRTAIEEPRNGDAVSTSAMWALAWLTNAKSSSPYTVYTFSEIELDCLRKLSLDNRRDAYTRMWAALILSACRVEASVFDQADWIYNWAVVADGGKPHKQLAIATPLNYPREIEVLKYLISSKLPMHVKRWVAIALGRLGCFILEMVEPLSDFFQDEILLSMQRDEALVYLVLTGGEKVKSLLTEGMDYLSDNRKDSKQDSTKYDVFSRYFLAIVGMGDIESLKYQLELARGDKIDLNAFAYTLAGIDSPEGQKVLESMKNHKKEKVRSAARDALLKAKKWDFLETQSKVGLGLDNLKIRITQGFRQSIKTSLSVIQANSTSSQESKYVDRQVAERGHLIHQIKAKDSTGSWAYYFILISPNSEQEFLQSLDSGESIDLENYGKIIASCYGEEPSKKIRNFLKEKYGFNV